MLARLPDFMKETTAQGAERVRADARADVPVALFCECCGIHRAGGSRYCGSTNRGRNFPLFAWSPPAALPTHAASVLSAINYPHLAWIAASTATTILAVRALLELQQDRDLSTRSTQTFEFHRQSPGCIAAVGSLQRFRSSCALLRYLPSTKRPSVWERLVSAMATSRAASSRQCSCVSRFMRLILRYAAQHGQPLQRRPTAGHQLLPLSRSSARMACHSPQP